MPIQDFGANEIDRIFEQKRHSSDNAIPEELRENSERRISEKRDAGMDVNQGPLT